MRTSGLRTVAMKGTAPLLAVFVLLVAGVAMPVAGSVSGSTGAPDHAPQAETETNASGESGQSAAPGAQFAGVVDVQEAEVESELEARAFDIRVERSNSDESKAAVVAEQVDELNRRMATLRERKRTLDQARDNGSISEARYRAEVAALAARSVAIERQLDRSETASNDIPADVLESKGVNATAIVSLRNESRTVAGPGAADIARSIAGPGVGGGLDERNGSVPTSAPGRSGSPNGSDTPDGPPGTGEFDTPTHPGNGNGTGPPTGSDGPGLPNVTDNVTDVLSPIVGGSDGDGETETTTEADGDNETATDDGADNETATDDGADNETATDDGSSGTTTG